MLPMPITCTIVETNVCVNTINWFFFSGMLSTSLHSQLVGVLKSCYADATKASYRTHLKSWSAFCVVMGIPLLPIEPRSAALYAVLLSRSLKYDSIPQYLNMLSLLHRSMGLKSPLDCFLVKSVMRGLKNTMQQEPSFKLPVTPKILYCILSNMNLDSVSDSCVWMSCLVLFYGLLRKSNVVGVHKVLRSDCHLTSKSLNITVRSSKTRNKTTDPPRVISLPIMKGHRLCPVSAAIHFLSMSSHLPRSAPLCAIPKSATGAGFNMLSYKLITGAVQGAVPPEQSQQYATHSFRRGGATHLFSIGVPCETIRLLGDWRSDAYRRYIMVDTQAVSYSAISAMQASLTTPSRQNV